MALQDQVAVMATRLEEYKETIRQLEYDLLVYKGKYLDLSQVAGGIHRPVVPTTVPPAVHPDDQLSSPPGPSYVMDDSPIPSLDDILAQDISMETEADIAKVIPLPTETLLGPFYGQSVSLCGRADLPSEISRQVDLSPLYIEIDVIKFEDRDNFNMWQYGVKNVLCSLNLEDVLDGNECPGE
ncbi:hypothetical protein KSP40_PGU005379 [Platanthera guangdongensis]|uniref:Uncharacterized protein n=1 Tax=Platanthera guangdongensis TaxID=2320717 RepID=A0ABR2MV51_9ASPA